MKILIGLTIIAVAVAIMFAAAWVCEKERRKYWFEEWNTQSAENFDLIKQLNDERKHSDMLQKENNLLNKEKANFLHNH